MKRELTQNLQIAYFHYGYLQKKACVAIIHCIEKYSRYSLYNSHEMLGLHEQLEWEALIIGYLEQTHAFIEKQRKVYKNICHVSGFSLDEERNKIIGPVLIDHSLIIKARNAIHHDTFQITSFTAIPGPDGKSLPSPNIRWPQADLTLEQKKYIEDNFPYGGDKLIPFFWNHCSKFISTGNELGQFLLQNMKAIN